MKFNTFNWNLYKESPRGKRLIEDFSSIQDANAFTELIIRLRPNAGINPEAFANVLDCIYIYKVSEIEDSIKEGTKLTTDEVWTELVSTGYIAEDEIIIKPGEFREMLDLVPFLSINLYISYLDSFIPYLFFESFAQLASILESYEVEIPPIPPKKDYEARCHYYLDLNDALLDFRDKIGLSPAEFCAFLYDFAPSQIEKEDVPSTFSRMWISGGHVDHSDLNKTYYWGNNAMARKGDLMLLYELSPVSAITSLWRLTTDGCEDPFFQWNAQAGVIHITDFPSVTLQELRDDEYFSHHPLVRRNMQGVNGTAWSTTDYKNLLRLIADKEFDISILPRIDGMDTLELNVEIHLEKDVEEKLLIPLLYKFDIKDGSGYIRQLPVKAGRGHRVFPDFAIYYSDKHDEEWAHILVEAKLDIRNEKELSEAFKQAKSYAQLLDSSVIILCDKNYLYIYEKGSSIWDSNKYIQISWAELSDADHYSEIARIFDKKNYL